MSNRLLQVKNLKTWFGKGADSVRAVDGVDFQIEKGETFALLGESGCGKSMTSLSIMGLVPKPAGQVVDGEILLEDQDLLTYSESQMRKVRGARIGMIFQEPMTALNPVLSVGQQISESLSLHKGLTGRSAASAGIELLEAVGIPDPARRWKEYPHQLSGGMKQRVMIAMALAGEPDLLIADEPTTALDVTIQAQVLDLLRDLQKQRGMAILLITHDLGVVAEMADRVAVMYAGRIAEHADRESFFKRAGHPYSQKLFQSLPNANKRDQALTIIPGSVPSLRGGQSGCRFASRCASAWSQCTEQEPALLQTEAGHEIRCHLFSENNEQERQQDPASAGAPPIWQGEGGAQRILDVEDLKVHFPITKGLFQRVVGHVKAVDGLDLHLDKGRTLALVGESGCGKTTAGKGIIQLLKPTAGNIQFQGEDLQALKGEGLRKARQRFQIIFQDPYASMNPRMRIGDIIAEGMESQGIAGDAIQRQAKVDQLLQQVGLTTDIKNRYPHEFSGGQRQRICIARALAVNPELIVCDEPTSALDVSVQAQILNLLRELQAELGLSYLFITHNIAVVAFLAHEVAVMYLGRIVERGTVEQVLSAPKHPYTEALLSAVPVVDLERERDIIRLEGDLPSPANPPQGCHFHPRCPKAMDICREVYPETVVTDDSQTVACHLHMHGQGQSEVA